MQILLKNAKKKHALITCSNFQCKPNLKFSFKIWKNFSEHLNSILLRKFQLVSSEVLSSSITISKPGNMLKLAAAETD